jgi:hypothetical protein
MTNDPQSGTQLLPGAIVGIIIGSIAFLIVIALVIICFLRAHFQRDQSVEGGSGEECSAIVDFVSFDDDATTFATQEAPDGIVAWGSDDDDSGMVIAE